VYPDSVAAETSAGAVESAAYTATPRRDRAPVTATATSTGLTCPPLAPRKEKDDVRKARPHPSAQRRTPVPLRPFSPEALTVLSTEHYTLQSAGAATTNESNRRASLYLASVGGGVVALALVAESTGTTSASARLFATSVLAALVLMGLLTHQRLVHLTVEDAVLGQAIARIRSSHLHAAPEIAPYLLLPTADDRAGVLHNTGVAHSGWHHLSHMAVMVTVVVSAVTGTATAMAANAIAPDLAVAVPAGVTTAALTVLALTCRQIRAWYR